MQFTGMRSSLIAALACTGCSPPVPVADLPFDQRLPFTIESAPAFRPGAIGDTREPAFFQSAVGDLNGDDLDDRAAVLVQDSDGSGVFYYLSVILRAGEDAWRPGGDVFLGDRIEVESLTIEACDSDASAGASDAGRCSAIVAVRYRERSLDQPMTARPSVDRLGRWRVDGDTLNRLH